jgi:hypothetical protein
MVRIGVAAWTAASVSELDWEKEGKLSNRPKAKPQGRDRKNRMAKNTKVSRRTAKNHKKSRPEFRTALLVKINFRGDS